MFVLWEENLPPPTTGRGRVGLILTLRLLFLGSDGSGEERINQDSNLNTDNAGKGGVLAVGGARRPTHAAAQRRREAVFSQSFCAELLSGMKVGCPWETRASVAIKAAT